MDLTLVDVGGLPGISVGDEVVLLGSSDGLSVDVGRRVGEDHFAKSSQFQSGLHEIIRLV
jgi:alanine racemase